MEFYEVHKLDVFSSTLNTNTRSCILLCVGIMIRLLTKVENIIGVYRNYDIFKRRYKLLIAARIVLETILPLVLLCNYIFITASVDSRKSDLEVIYIMLYQILFCLSNLTFFLCALYTSKSFSIFSHKLLAVQPFIQQEPMYIKVLKKLKMFFITITIVYCFFSPGLAILSILDFHYTFYSGTRSPKGFISSSVIMSYLDIRFVIEHLVLFIYTIMLKHLSKYLSSSIYVVQQKVNNYTRMRTKADEENTNACLTVETVNEWASTYYCLKCCAAELSVCFKYQVMSSYDIAEI